MATVKMLDANGLYDIFSRAHNLNLLTLMIDLKLENVCRGAWAEWGPREWGITSICPVAYTTTRRSPAAIAKYLGLPDGIRICDFISDWDNYLISNTDLAKTLEQIWQERLLSAQLVQASHQISEAQSRTHLAKQNQTK